MKIAFITPPAIDGKAPERLFGCNYGVYFQPNIFTLYSAALLEENGHSVKVIDAPAEGISTENFESLIMKDCSDVYIFYTVFLSEQIDKTWFKWLRNVNPQAAVIFVGPEPTSKPEKFVLDLNTFAIRGEIEHAALELVSSLKRRNFGQILGLSWEKNGKIIHNPPRPLMSDEDLDKLPFPARHLVKRNRYFNPKLKGRPSTVMLTARNCWGRCIYCIPSSYTFAREIENRRYFGCKPRVGLRSAENIIKEFRRLKKEGYKSVAIIDDNFVNGKERTIEICKGVERLGIEWGCLARADQLQDEELLQRMKQAGCKFVDIGVESFDQKVLDYVQKDTKVGDQLNAIMLLKKVGIEPKVNILLGASPFQTEADIRWTVEVLKSLDVDYVSFGVVTPHPGTEFYKTVKSKGWFATKTKDFEPVDPTRQAIISLPNMDSKKLQELVRWAYRRHYLRTAYVVKRLRRIKSLRELKENVSAATKLLR